MSFYLVEQKSIRAGLDVTQYGLRRYGSPFAFQILGNSGGGKSGAYIRSHIGNNPFQHVHIPDVISLDNIFQLHGVEQVPQILAAGCFVIAEVRQIGHTACGQILAETLAGISIRVDGTVQLDKFRKGERIDHKFHIPSGQIGSQLAGKQLGIGTGDINVTVQLHAEGIDTFFPGVHLLYLIKKKIDLALDFRSLVDDLIMECHGSAEMGIAHILKVNGDKLAAVHAGAAQFLFNQIQHDRLPASADTGQDLYQVVSDERTNTAHIGFPFNHNDLPPFLGYLYDTTDMLNFQARKPIFNGYN